VARARAASTAASSRLPPSARAAVTSASAAAQAPRRAWRGPRQPGDLRLAHRALSMSRMSIGSSFVLAVLVDADDHLLAPVDGA
jgi:hypothetical protein